MIKAINTKKQIVPADNAEYNPHWCPECKELVFLRKPKNAIPHFYHARYNINCSLCVEKKDNFSFIEYNFEKDLSELKMAYSERWNNAIDNLIKYEGLDLLYGKDWALEPIKFYINSHLENINNELFYIFFHIISGINNVNAFKALQMLLNLPIINKKHKEYLNNILYKCCKNEEVFEYILFQLRPDIFTMYMYFIDMTQQQQQKIILDKEYEPISWLHYIFSANNRIDKYKYVIKKYSNQWNNDKYDSFNNLLLFCIEKIRNDFSNRLFGNCNAYDDLYQYIKEHKYYAI